MIGIRADANETIAMGHVMRCIAIGKQLLNRGEEVMFISSENNVKELLIAQGFQFHCLYNRYDEKEAELEALLAITKEYEIGTLLLDSYQVTEYYMRILHEHLRLVYLDDLAAFPYPAEIVINYSYCARRQMYAEEHPAAETQYYLGSRYIPLRAEFAANRIEIKRQVQGIFITTGGTDNYDMILKLVDALCRDEFCNIKKYVVVGKFYKSLKALKVYESEQVQIFQNISDIYTVMKQCDIAISAGGTTVSELCAMGIPTIAFTMADNQLNGTKAYAEDKLILYAGDIRKQPEETTGVVLRQVKQLIQDYEARQSMSKRALEQIDGMGAGRIAELL